jgi:GNAT superfamily N-acetyltransferase
MAIVTEQLLPDYRLWQGSSLDRALLVQFMQRTYRELYPGQSFAHLAQTVDQYLSPDTPLWWVKRDVSTGSDRAIACLWLGNAIDQVRGDRHAHVFLLYVIPEHRRQGVGSALMQYAEAWAKQRGDHQIGLQVFQANQPALNLYTKLGYETQSLWMIKPFDR